MENTKTDLTLQTVIIALAVSAMVVAFEAIIMLNTIQISAVVAKAVAV